MENNTLCKKKLGEEDEVIEIVNVKKIMRQIALNKVEQVPRVAITIVMDELSEKLQRDIEEETNNMIEKIKTLCQEEHKAFNTN